MSTLQDRINKKREQRLKKLEKVRYDKYDVSIMYQSHVDFDNVVSNSVDKCIRKCVSKALSMIGTDGVITGVLVKDKRGNVLKFIAPDTITDYIDILTEPKLDTTSDKND